MAYKNTVVASNGNLRIMKSVKKSGSIKFLIKYTGIDYDKIAELDAICDPYGNRKVRYESWKFNTLQEAKESMTLAILKGIHNG